MSNTNTNSKTIIKYNKNAQLPSDFDWKTYVSLNEDLAGFNETKAKSHYLIFGINENRVYKKDESDLNNSESSITYEVINETYEDNYVDNRLWCHVYCNNPNELIFKDEFSKVAKYFSIIFTCDSVNNEDIPSDYTILKVNKMYSEDIKKECVANYLDNKNYTFDLLISMTY